MTVMSSSGTEMTIDQLALTAYQLAGLLEETQTLADANGGSLARRLLGTIVTELQGQGIIARAVTFYEQTLVSGTSSYSMPSTVLDVFGDAMYIPEGQTVSRADSETVVENIPRERWQNISAKSASGTPTQYYVHREVTPPSVRLWPVPDEAGTIRFQVHRHLADSSSGAATVDLEVYWTTYIMYRLAQLLAEAKSLPADKRLSLRAEAMAAKSTAKSMASDRRDNQFYVAHRTGW